MSEKIPKTPSVIVGGLPGHRGPRTSRTSPADPTHISDRPTHLPAIDAGGATQRAAAHHADLPKLQRTWGMPSRLHRVLNDAKKAERPITALIGGHASAADAVQVAQGYPQRTIVTLRTEPFASPIALPAGHVVLYRGSWFAALEDLRAKPDAYGPTDHIVLLPGFSTKFTVAPFELLRALLSRNGRLSALVSGVAEAERLSTDFRNVFTLTRNEFVHVFGFMAHPEVDIMMPMNLQNRAPEAIDAMEIMEISASHFPKAVLGQPTPFYWVIATRASRLP